MTYRTDAAPDYVIRREALTVGLLAPLHLAAGVANNFSEQSALRAAGCSFALFVVLTGLLLTRSSMRGIFLSAAVLVAVLATSVVLLLRNYAIHAG